MKHLTTVPLLIGVVASLLQAQETPRHPKMTETSIGTHMRGTPRCKASQLIGCAITNTKNESLGEIQDIVLDNGNHRIAYAVVAFGGFLGMGEKYFAMPWRLIEVEQRSADVAPRATLGLDKDKLKAAPGFDKAKWPDMGSKAWAKQVDDYYESRNEKARPEGAAEPKGGSVDGKSGIDQAPASAAFVHRRLSRLIGMQVVDLQDKKLAEVEDLVVDPSTAAIDGALLSFGGVLGIGEKMVLVPFDALTLDRAQKAFVFPCSKPELEAMVLVDGKLPALNENAWLTNGRELCAKAKVANTAMSGDVIIGDASGVVSVPFADAYDVDKVETIKGTIGTVGSVRIGDDNEERLRLRVRGDKGHEVIVYAAPSTFEAQQLLALQSGKVIEVTGSPTQYGSQTVLVAGSITVDGKTACLRDEKGHPVWTQK